MEAPNWRNGQYSFPLFIRSIHSALYNVKASGKGESSGAHVLSIKQFKLLLLWT